MTPPGGRLPLAAVFAPPVLMAVTLYVILVVVMLTRDDNTSSTNNEALLSVRDGARLACERLSAPLLAASVEAQRQVKVLGRKGPLAPASLTGQTGIGTGMLTTSINGFAVDARSAVEMYRTAGGNFGISAVYQVGAMGPNASWGITGCTNTSCQLQAVEGTALVFDTATPGTTTSRSCNASTLQKVVKSTGVLLPSTQAVWASSTESSLCPSTANPTSVIITVAVPLTSVGGSQVIRSVNVDVDCSSAMRPIFATLGALGNNAALLHIVDATTVVVLASTEAADVSSGGSLLPLSGLPNDLQSAVGSTGVAGVLPGAPLAVDMESTVAVAMRFDVNNAPLAFVAIVPKPAPESDSNRREVLAVIICGVLLALLVISVVGIYIATSTPIAEMRDRMILSANLEEIAVEDEPYFITELFEAQEAFYLLRGNLEALKGFVPQGLLVETLAMTDSSTTDTIGERHMPSERPANPLMQFDSDPSTQSPTQLTPTNSSSHGRHGMEAPHNSSLQPVGPQTHNLDNGVSSGGDAVGNGKETEYQRAQRRLSKMHKANDSRRALDHKRLFNGVVNQLVLTDCVVIVVKCILPDTRDPSFSSRVNDFQRRVGTAVTEEGGVLEQLRPNRILASFGARRVINNPSDAARRAAFAIHAGLNKGMKLPAFRCSVVVDRGSFLVGSVGTEQVRQEGIFSAEIERLELIPDLSFQRLAAPVIATERVAPAFTTSCAKVPIDCLEWGNDEAARELLFAVEPTTTPEWERLHSNSGLPEIIRLSFSHMRQGDYRTALAVLSDPGEADTHSSFRMTVERFGALCTAKASKDSEEGEPYRRPFFGWGTTNGELFFGFMDSEYDSSSFARERSHAIQIKGRQPAVNKVVDQITAMREKEQQPIFNTFGLSSGSQTGGFVSLALPTSDTSEHMASATLPTMDSDDNSLKSTPSQQKRADAAQRVRVSGKVWLRGRNGLGSGAYGQVYRVLNENGSMAAVKMLPLKGKNTDLAEMQKELVVASQLNHENLVKYVDTAVHKNELMLLMELVPGGSLQTVLDDFGSLPLNVVRRYLVDILRGLVHVHREGIVHCDMKPQNVLIGIDGSCKVADFGSCVHPGVNFSDEPNQFTDDEIKVPGTPAYMAPEVARGETPSSASDVWSFGIMVHELISGQLPWNEAQRQVIGGFRFIQALSRLDPGAPSLAIHALPDVNLVEFGGGDSELAQEFVQSCLQLDPAQRPTAEALLSSPFLLA